jgi:hypothetical protein
VGVGAHGRGMFVDQVMHRFVHVGRGTVPNAVERQKDAGRRQRRIRGVAEFERDEDSSGCGRRKDRLRSRSISSIPWATALARRSPSAVESWRASNRTTERAGIPRASVTKPTRTSRARSDMKATGAACRRSSTARGSDGRLNQIVNHRSLIARARRAPRVYWSATARAGLR